VGTGGQAGGQAEGGGGDEDEAQGTGHIATLAGSNRAEKWRYATRPPYAVQRGWQGFPGEESGNPQDSIIPCGPAFISSEKRVYVRVPQQLR
jgi:hypothetical protein